MGCVTPAAVTCLSSIASNKADWVLGGVRLISSASKMLVKIGPLTNFSVRPPSPSSTTSEPTTSAGNRSGVNWMRLKSTCRISATVLISSVFAKPGTPVTRTWPPPNRAISNSSIIDSWPMITFFISATIFSLPSCIRSTNARSS